MHDLLLRGGWVIDPANDVDGRFDVAIDGHRVAGVAPTPAGLPARRTVDVRGRWVLPGLVDVHVHLSEPFGGPQGFRMLAAAGVTCALDLAGFADSLVEGVRGHGTGLTIGFVHPIIPGRTVTDVDPDGGELSRLMDEVAERGALGVKVLGGHFPCTPAATARALRLAHERRLWCAVHAGTTEAGSDVEGLEELVDLAGDLPLHVAHVNSYCRGQREEPLSECVRALRALSRAPRARSDSYLSPWNAAPATVEDGAPTSRVVRTCLRMNGYGETERGLRAAIRDGVARVHRAAEGVTRLLGSEDGLAHFERRGSAVGVSFAVNPPESAISLAIAREDGDFQVTALATDGGAFPRNTTLEQGLALVRFGAISLTEFVAKASVAPAQMLGLPAKGHLGEGADADAIVVDPATSRAQWVVARGRVVVEDGVVVGQGGRMLTTTAGARFLREQGVEIEIVRPGWLGNRDGAGAGPPTRRRRAGAASGPKSGRKP